jgi:hypothetical protein
MGVCNFASSKFEEMVSLFDDSSVLDVIEIGDQEMVIDGIGCSPDHKFRNSVKHRFRNWRTLDLHDVQGVEMFDLSKKSDEIDCADIMTNFGTSEHVEYEEGQYNCWSNMHNQLRVGGYILHIVPPPGQWIGHARYHYGVEFFDAFKNIGYDIKEMSMTYNNLILCLMKKTTKVEFMSFDKFMSIITFNQITSDEVYHLNNPKNLEF